MGAFSWLRAERTTQRKNIAVGDIYKILIRVVIADAVRNQAKSIYKFSCWQQHEKIRYWRNSG